MKIIPNNDRWILPEVLEQCFEKGVINTVDKVLCGNGFSTAFLKSVPPKGKINIIIAPNIPVIKSKADAYYSDTSGEWGKRRINFLYQGSKNKNIEGFDTLMFVADSFLLKIGELLRMKHMIHRILIDEVHSLEQQSAYRPKLKPFMMEIEPFLQYSAVSTVTASPNYIVEPTIQIKNRLIKSQVWFNSLSPADSVNRANKLIKAGKRVAIFTNSRGTMKLFKDAHSKILKARFNMGETLGRKMAFTTHVERDEEEYPQLILSSSSGFEGMDILGEGYHVFFFEDRNWEFQTFYTSNIYQAVNRTRNGAKYIEIVTRYRINLRKIKVTESQLDKFVKDPTISSETKLSKTHKDNHPFIISRQDKEGKITIHKSNVAIGLQNERLKRDDGFIHYPGFLKDRKIKINDISGITKPLPVMKLRREEKVKNLLANVAFIESNNLFGDEYVIDTKYYENPNDYAKAVDEYIMCKNYKGDYIPTDRQVKAMEILTNAELFNKMIIKMTEDYKAYKKPILKRRAFIEAVQRFEGRIRDILRYLCLAFANDVINASSKWVANRDYNVWVEVCMDNIRYIGKEFGVEATEIDLKSAFSRTLYALNGEVLPEDFYGAQKENKIAINTFLNNFMYEPNLEGIVELGDDGKLTAQDKKSQRAKAIRKFRALGFNEKVLQYVVDKFFEGEFRGDLFNAMAFQEKKIVSVLKKEILENNINEGAVRRHDSVIVFNNESDLSYLNEYVFLGQKGWVEAPSLLKQLHKYKSL